MARLRRRCRTPSRCRSGLRCDRVRARCRCSDPTCSTTRNCEISPPTSSTSGIRTTPAACPSDAPGPCRKASWRGSSAWAHSSRWWRGSGPGPRCAAADRAKAQLMPDAPRDGRARAELTAAVCFGISTLAAIGLAIVYWRGGNTQAEGALLTLVTGGIGVGIIVWAKEAMPQDEVTEERLSVASSEGAIEAFTADFEAGKEGLGRRRVLFGLAASAFGVFGAALLFPIRSLGPRPG